MVYLFIFARIVMFSHDLFLQKVLEILIKLDSLERRPEPSSGYGLLMLMMVIIKLESIYT